MTAQGLFKISPATADGAEAQAASEVRPVSGSTASMQSLLASYFESQGDAGPVFEPARVHALSAPQTETRATRAEDVAVNHAAEAAFVPFPASPEITPPTPAPDSASFSSEWPPSAHALIDSLHRENERLRSELMAAQNQADRDVLTPALNRRAFLREAQRAMADCRRYGEDATLLYIDMDGFKSINDNHGHAAGDAALIYVAETLAASVREGDAIGRIGGDEFAVLLRRADLSSSRVKAMKLEAELMMGTFEYAGLYLKVGASFGVRAYASQASAEAWLSEADAAMFLVKKAIR